MDEKWTGLVLRLQQEADSVLKNNKDGVCITTVNIVMTHDGDPVIWVVSSSARVEPSNRAAEVVSQLTRAV